MSAVTNAKESPRRLPVDGAATSRDELEKDPLYHAPALGKWCDRLTSRDHDTMLYGK